MSTQFIVATAKPEALKVVTTDIRIYRQHMLSK